jgi:hypothetical protein
MCKELWRNGRRLSVGEREGGRGVIRDCGGAVQLCHCWGKGRWRESVDGLSAVIAGEEAKGRGIVRNSWLKLVSSLC